MANAMRTRMAAVLILSSVPISATAEEIVVVKAKRMFTGRQVVSPAVLVARGEKITAANAQAKVPPGAKVYDFGDATIVPGLIDAHTHLTGQRSDDWHKDVTERMRRGVPEASMRAAHFAKLTLEAGFTTVRNVGSSDHIDIGLERAIAAGWIVGPRIVGAGYSLGARGGHCDDNGFPPGRFGKESGIAQGIAAGPDQFRDAVRYQIKYGAKVIKFCATGGVLSLADDVDTPQLTREEMKALIEEAHRLGRKVAAHAHGDLGARLAVQAGVDSIEHGTFLTRDTFRQMKSRGTFLVPTMMAYDSVDPERAELPPEIAAKARAAIAARAKSIRLALKMGVPIAVGSDSGVYEHGKNMGEVVLLVRHGMTPRQALEAATVQGAKLIGWSARLGSLEPGKLADVVVMRGDPLRRIEDANNVVFVMKGGEVIRSEVKP